MTPTVHIMIRKPVAGADAPIAEQLADQLAAIADRVDGGEKLVTTLSTAVLRVVIAKLRQSAPRAPQHAVEANERARQAIPLRGVDAPVAKQKPPIKPPAPSKPRLRVKAGMARS